MTFFLFVFIFSASCMQKKSNTGVHLNASVKSRKTTTISHCDISNESVKQILTDGTLDVQRRDFIYGCGVSGSRWGEERRRTWHGARVAMVLPGEMAQDVTVNGGHKERIRQEVKKRKREIWGTAKGLEGGHNYLYACWGPERFGCEGVNDK